MQYKSTTNQEAAYKLAVSMAMAAAGVGAVCPSGPREAVTARKKSAPTSAVVILGGNLVIICYFRMFFIVNNISALVFSVERKYLSKRESVICAVKLYAFGSTYESYHQYLRGANLMDQIRQLVLYNTRINYRTKFHK